MTFLRALRVAAALTIVVPGRARGQDLPALLARGIAAVQALDPHGAADAFETILSHDSLNAEANWRASLALIDIAKQTPEEQPSVTRDSLYGVAEVYARRAVRLAPEEPNGHFALAMALGKTALTVSWRQRTKYAVEIRKEALRTLELDPRHNGAMHVLGRWNAEVERLSNVEEFVARKFLGAGVFEEASWAEATRHLEAAVALRPTYIYHRLILAKIYIDLKRYDAARAQLAAIPGLPTTDVMDHAYRAEAASLLTRIANRK